jgi:hypothetical protein
MLVHTPGAAFTVRFAGHVIAGNCVSFTVTVKVHWLLLPLLSRAVLVTVVVPRGKAKPLAGTLEMFVTAQLSVAVTLNVTLLMHTPGAAFTVMLVGHAIRGNWVSVTVTVKVQVLELPLVSRAVLVTVVIPTGKANPLAGTLTKLVTAQLSLAVTLKVTLLVHPPAIALTSKLSGQVIRGGCASLTLTVNVQVLELPLLSSAVLVTIVTPTGKTDPLAGTTAKFVTAQLSVAVTV